MSTFIRCLLALASAFLSAPSFAVSLHSAAEHLEGDINRQYAGQQLDEITTVRGARYDRAQMSLAYGYSLSHDGPLPQPYAQALHQAGKRHACETLTAIRMRAATMPNHFRVVHVFYQGDSMRPLVQMSFTLLEC